MITLAPAPILWRLSDAAALLTLAAVGAALILPDPYAAVPDHLRPGAWSQDALSTPAALALLAVNWRLRQGWTKGWLIWAGLIGYLIYAYGLYSLDRVMNPAYPLYLAVLAASVLAAILFVRAAEAAALTSARRPPPRRAVAGCSGCWWFCSTRSGCRNFCPQSPRANRCRGRRSSCWIRPSPCH